MVAVRRFTLLLFALLALGWLTPARAEPQFPALTGRVVDDAAVIAPDIEGRLAVKLRNFEEQTGRQLVVATIADLQNYDIETYGYLLGRHWGIGSKEKSDGVLLIVAPRERRLRIEVGYGLEAVLTDGMASLIINQTIVPYFKSDMMGAGIEAGADAIMAQLALPPEEAQRLAAEADAQENGPGTFWPLVLVFGFVTLFFVGLIALIGRTGPRYSAGAGGGRMSTWHSGGGGGGSSWSSSSSSFSGGGGSFGGGGASGSW